MKPRSSLYNKIKQYLIKKRLPREKGKSVPSCGSLWAPSRQCQGSGGKRMLQAPESCKKELENPGRISPYILHEFKTHPIFREIYKYT